MRQSLKYQKLRDQEHHTIKLHASYTNRKIKTELNNMKIS